MFNQLKFSKYRLYMQKNCAILEKKAYQYYLLAGNLLDFLMLLCLTSTDLVLVVIAIDLRKKTRVYPSSQTRLALWAECLVDIAVVREMDCRYYIP